MSYPSPSDLRDWLWRILCSRSTCSGLVPDIRLTQCTSETPCVGPRPLLLQCSTVGIVPERMGTRITTDRTTVDQTDGHRIPGVRTSGDQNVVVVAPQNVDDRNDDVRSDGNDRSGGDPQIVTGRNTGVRTVGVQSVPGRNVADRSVYRLNIISVRNNTTNVRNNTTSGRSSISGRSNSSDPTYILNFIAISLVKTILFNL